MISPMLSDTVELRALLPSYKTSLRARNRSPVTIEMSERFSLRLADWLDETGHSTKVGDITSRTLETYLVHLGEELSATTVGIHYRGLRAFFNWMYKEDEIDRSPFAGMVQPKADEKPVPIFTQAELRALLDTAQSRSFTDRRDRAVIMTFIDTGVRLGELTSMRLDEMEYEHQIVRVDGKTGARFIKFGNTAWEAVDRYLRARAGHTQVDRPEFWLSPKGALTDSGVAQMLKKRGRLAEVEGVNPHRFRHTFAHNWLADGGQENDLVQLAGWTSSQMVARYGRSAAASRAMDAKMRNSPGDRL